MDTLKVDSGMAFPLVLPVSGLLVLSRFFREFRVRFEMNGLMAWGSFLVE